MQAYGLGSKSQVTHSEHVRNFGKPQVQVIADAVAKVVIDFSLTVESSDQAILAVSR